MLSTAAIVIRERLAAKYSRFYERLLATLDISVQSYIASCADSYGLFSLSDKFPVCHMFNVEDHVSAKHKLT
jgi:hypothetical protein